MNELKSAGPSSVIFLDVGEVTLISMDLLCPGGTVPEEELRLEFQLVQELTILEKALHEQSSGKHMRNSKVNMEVFEKFEEVRSYPEGKYKYAWNPQSLREVVSSGLLYQRLRRFRTRERPL